MMPVAMPKIGEPIRAMTILPIPAKFRPSAPTDTSTAPMMPPTRAWEELEGTASHQVTIFQTTAPTRAAMMMCSSTCWADFTISAPMVLATPVEYIAPAKFSTAAIIMAWLG